MLAKLGVYFRSASKAPQVKRERVYERLKNADATSNTDHVPLEYFLQCGLLEDLDMAYEKEFGG